MFVLFKRPGLIRLYVQLGIEYELPIRYSQADPAPDHLDPNDTECVKAYREGLALLRSHRMPIFNIVDTDNYEVKPTEKRAYYFTLFNRLRPGVSEILIHCAYGPEGPMHAPAAARRAADTRVFLSQDTADTLRAREFG